MKKKKTSLEKDRLKLQGRVEQGYVLSKEWRLYGSLNKLVEKVEILED